MKPFFTQPVKIFRSARARDAGDGVRLSHVEDTTQIWLADVQPMPAREAMRLGLPITERVTDVYFNVDVTLQEGDRIEYQREGGEWREVRVENYVDEAGAGVMWAAMGKDLRATVVVAKVTREAGNQLRWTFSRPVQWTGGVNGLQAGLNTAAFQNGNVTSVVDPTAIIIEYAVLPAVWRVSATPPLTFGGREFVVTGGGSVP